ncbi:MAG: hypothetical protein ACOYL6_02330 [Bacteriovoracaceae bacterium]
MKFELNNLNPIEKLIYHLVGWSALFGLILCLLNKEYYEGVYAKEDSYLEYLTVYALFLSAQTCFLRLFKLRKKKQALFLFCTLCACGIFLFGAGEEISWGQRIFNIQSSDYFAQNNSQGETNLHNLVVEGKKVNKIIFGTGLGIVVATYLLLLPLLYRKKQQVKVWIDKLGIPVAKNHHILAYALLFAIVSLIPSSKRGEVLELGGCMIFYLMLSFPLNQENFR